MAECEFQKRFVAFALVEGQDNRKHIVEGEFSAQEREKHEIPNRPGVFYVAKTWCGKLAPWIITENKTDDESAVCEACLLQAGILWRY